MRVRPPAPEGEVTAGTQPRSFQEFWPSYLGEHSRIGTRALHFTGTTMGLLGLGAAAALRRPVLVAWGLCAAYGLAWIGHFFVEKNRPATFRHPLWSLRGDLRMYGLMSRGRLDAELKNLRLPSRPR